MKTYTYKMEIFLMVDAETEEEAEAKLAEEHARLFHAGAALGDEIFINAASEDKPILTNTYDHEEEPSDDN